MHPAKYRFYAFDGHLLQTIHRTYSRMPHEKQQWSYWKAGQAACGNGRPVFQSLPELFVIILIFL